MGKEFIARILENSGKTKKQFARDIGVKSVTVDKWLSGIYKPSPENQSSIRVMFKKEIARLYK